jgi:hypothetical protein
LYLVHTRLLCWIGSPNANIAGYSGGGRFRLWSQPRQRRKRCTWNNQTECLAKNSRFVRFFDFKLERFERIAPEAVEPLAQFVQALSPHGVNPAHDLASLRDKPGVFEHLEMLRHRRPRHRQPRRRCIHRPRPGAPCEPCPPGTEFLDAETGPSKSPPETTHARRDQKDPKPLTQIPAQTAYLNSIGKYPVRRDLDSRYRTGCPPRSHRTRL